ncbi:MAG: alpha/beta fold hydrolase [Candidatus Woesearchaeota archaeon]
MASPLNANKKPSKQRRISRLHTWYTKRPKYIRILLVIGLLAFLILLLQGLLLLGLWFESIRGGLAVFVEPHNSIIQLEGGEDIVVGFDISVQNLPLCKAVCEMEIRRHDTNTIIYNGSKEVLSGTTYTINTTLTDNMHRHQYPITLTASCQNQEGGHCQRNPLPSIARTTSMIGYQDTPEERIAREYLQGEGRVRMLLLQEHLAELNGIANIQTMIIPSIRGEASRQAQEIRERLSRAQEAYTNNNPILAMELLRKGIDRKVIEDYNKAVNKEREHSVLIAEYNTMRHDIRAIASISDREDYERLLSLTETIRKLAQDKSNTEIDYTHSQSLQAINTIKQIISNHDPILRDKTVRGTTLSTEEMRVACIIKDYGCNDIPGRITGESPEYMHDRLLESCNIIKNIESIHNNASIHYASIIEPGLSYEQTLQKYNITSIRQDTEFLTLEIDSVRNARMSITPVLNDTSRLAIRTDVLSTPTSSLKEECNLRTFPIPPSILLGEPELPVNPESSIIRDRWELPRQECCSFGKCEECKPSIRYPIIFLHGHSLTESSLPEYNIQAFTRMAMAMEEHNYYYAGNIFPQRTIREENIGLYNNLQQGVMFTSTYYYDSFEEDRKSHITPRKSENIETYGLRLREAIDATLLKTGSDKVIIIAHSMGGLVARSYITTFGDTKIAGLIMIGTPNAGVTDEVGLLCPVFGSNKECQDMKAGSFFIRKLNSLPPPTIPVMTISGYGCKDGPHDGLIALESVQLEYADNRIVNGTCTTRTHMLHGEMLKPDNYPETLNIILEFLEKNGIRKEPS